MHTVYAKLLKVAFNAIFSPCLLQAAKLKYPVFSPSLYQATKSKTVISGYMGQKKSVSDTSVCALLCAKQCRQDTSRIQWALPPASGAGEVISGRLEVPAVWQTIWILSFQDRGKWLIFPIVLLQLYQSGCTTNESTTIFFRLAPLPCSTLLKNCLFFFPLEELKTVQPQQRIRVTEKEIFSNIIKSRRW